MQPASFNGFTLSSPNGGDVMSQIVALLKFEEDYRDMPFIDTQGHPTVGCGIKIDPKGASLAIYIFKVPGVVGDLWMQALVMSKIYDMKQKLQLAEVLNKCNLPRADILYSMAYHHWN